VFNAGRYESRVLEVVCTIRQACSGLTSKVVMRKGGKVGSLNGRGLVSQCRQQLLMNPAKAAVGHHRYHVARTQLGS
jgi:hypothetical protein